MTLRQYYPYTVTGVLQSPTPPASVPRTCRPEAPEPTLPPTPATNATHTSSYGDSSSFDNDTYTTTIGGRTAPRSIVDSGEKHAIGGQSFGPKMIRVDSLSNTAAGIPGVSIVARYVTATLVSLLLSVVIVATSGTAHGSPVGQPAVQVRGSSRLVVEATGHRDHLRVIGDLRDETGVPIVNSPIHVQLVPDLPSDVEPTDAATHVQATNDPATAFSWRSVGDCSSRHSPVVVREGYLVVTTDSSGAFCIEGQLNRSRALIRVSFPGSSFHDGSRSELSWNEQQLPVRLVFDPEPIRVNLDEPRGLVFARLTVPPEHSASGLALSLTDERGTKLASTVSESHGGVHFDFDSSTIGPPGFGSFTVDYSGSDLLAPASATAMLSRTVRVELDADNVSFRTDTHRGLVMRMAVRSSRGPVPNGRIEVVLDDAIIGAGPVVDGVADVVLSLPDRVGGVALHAIVQYVGDSQYYEPAAPIAVAITPHRPSVALRLVPVAAGALVGSWLLRGWWRPRRRERRPHTAAVSRGEPSVSVVGRSVSPDLWSGKVVDVHDGAPISGANVRVVMPSFVGHQVLVDISTTSDGSFAFVVPDALLRDNRGRIRLMVESPYHGMVDRCFPPPSSLVVALATRRRLLLESLVVWARKAGLPWHREPESTPHHIAQVAIRNRGESVAAWAAKTECTVYGATPVDRSMEREVRDLEPP